MAHGHAHQSLTMSERAKLAALKQKYSSGAPRVSKASPSRLPSYQELYGSARPTPEPIKYELAIGVGMVVVTASLVYFLWGAQFHLKESLDEFLWPYLWLWK